MTIHCPKCHSASEVLDSRPNEEQNTIRRRRRCLSCFFRFTTIEISATTYNEHAALKTVTDTMTAKQLKQAASIVTLIKELQDES